MKKHYSFILLALLLLSAIATFGQTPNYINTQFPNPGFECWKEHSGAEVATGNDATKVPYNWHTFDEANINIWLGASEAKKNHHNYNTSGWQGSNIELICNNVSIFNVKANGALSCGRTNIGSTTGSNSANYNYTDVSSTSWYSTSGKFSWVFVGCPDSMAFRYKTAMASPSHNPLFKVFLHQSGEFRDRANGTLYGDSSVRLIGSSVDTFAQSISWKREVKAFTYSVPGQGGSAYTFLGQTGSLNEYGYYTSLNRPTYMLASFSTEKAAASGSANDKLAVDELWCIYDKGLKSLTIGGVAQTAMLNSFNAAEFATHEATRTYSSSTGDPTAYFNNGTAEYNYTASVCPNAIPVVAALPKSKLITGFTITQATASNPNATIVVTHNDGSTFTYTIHFNNVQESPATPAITQATPYPCGSGAVSLSVSSANAGYTYDWYLGGESTTSLHQGSSYNPNVTTNGTLYTVTAKNSAGCVSNRGEIYAQVNPLPATPNLAPTQVNLCGSGTVTFTVPAVQSPIEYHWYANNDNNYGTSQSNFITPPISSTTTYRVIAYNTSTTCQSEQVTATITVHTLPAAPTNIAGGSRCGEGAVALSATPASGTSCRWYVAQTGGQPLFTGDTCNPTVSQTTEFYVCSYNAQTGCESERVQVTATVNAVPNSPSVAQTEYNLCGATSVSLSGTVQQGTLEWRDANNGVLGTGSPFEFPLPDVDAYYQIHAVAVNNGCSSNPVEVSVHNGRVPAAPEGEGNRRCGAGTVELQAGVPGEPNAGIYWYPTQGSGEIIGQGSMYFTPDISQTTTYYVAAMIAGCSSTRTPVVATIIPRPEAPTVTSVEACGSYTGTLSATAPAGTTLEWHDAQGSPLNSTHVENITTTTNYTVVAVNTAEQCASLPATLTVTIYPNPGEPTPTTPVCVASGGNATLHIEQNGTGAVGYTWLTPDEAIISSNADRTIINVNASATYYVYATSSHNCNSEPVPVQIRLNPAMPNVSDITVCSAGDVTLSGVPAEGTSLQWYASDGTTRFDQGNEVHTSINGNSTFYVSAIDQYTCESAKKAVNVVVSESIPTPVITSSEFACGGNATLTATGTGLKWYQGEAEQTANADGTLTVTGLTTATAYAVVATSGNCESALASIMLIPSYIPDAPTVNSDNARCGAGEITVSVEQSNEIIDWFATADATTALQQGNSYTVENLHVTTTYYVSARNSQTGCASARVPVVATINALPEAPVTTPITVCGSYIGEMEATSAEGTYRAWFGDAEGEIHLNGPFADVNETTTFYVRAIDANGCESAMASLTVTILDEPAMPTASDVILCGAGRATLTATPAAGATCKWYDGNDQEVGTGNSYQTSNLSSDAVFYVTSVVGNCESAKKAVAVTVAVVPEAATAENQSRCGEGTITLTATPGNNANTIRWYNMSDALLSTGVEYTTESLTRTTQYKYASFNTETGCESSRQTVNAVVNPIPAEPTVTGNTPICGSGSLTLSANLVPNATTVRWNFSEAYEEGTTFTTPTLEQGVTFRVQSYNSNTQCISSGIDITIVVNEKPVAPAWNPMTVCEGAPVVLTCNSGDLETRWFATATSTQVLSNADEYTPSLNIGENHYYAQIINTTTNCGSDRGDYQVTVNALPAMPALSDVTLCRAGAVTLTGTPAEGTTFRWYYSNELSFTGDSWETSVNGSDNNISVSAYNEQTGCESAKDAVAVIVRESIAAPTAAANVYACGGSAVLSATPAEGTTLQWRNANNQALAANADGTLTVTGIEQATTYLALSVLDGCESDPTVITVSPASIPTVPQVTGAENCGAGEITLTVQRSNDIIDWFATADAETAFQQGNSYTTYIEETATYYVSARNIQTGCASARVPVTATIYAAPAAPETEDITACGRYMGELTATAAEGNLLAWFSDEAGQSPLSTTAVDVTENTTYYVRAIDEHSCPSAMASVGITINSLPAQPVADDVTLCGAGRATLTAEPTADCTCKWYDANRAFLATGSSYQTANLNGTTTFYVTSDNGTCESEMKAVVVTVAAVPAAAHTTSATNCGTGTLTLEAEPGDNGSTVLWYDAHNELAFTGTEYTLNNLENTTSFTCFSYNENTQCKATASATVTATIYPKPAMPAVSGNQPICGSGALRLTATSDANAAAYRWSTGATTAAINTGTLTQSTTYSVVAISRNNCESEPATVEVVVNPIPGEPQTADQTVCQGETLVLTATNVDGAVCHWYANATATEVLSTENQYTPDVTIGTATYYVSNYNTETGCESQRIAAVATINPTYLNVEETKEACGFYTWNNTIYEQSGDYTQNMHTIHGCDSVVTLHLTIHQSKQTVIDTTVCDRFVWAGDTYTASQQNIVKNFQTVNGCDSTVTVNLTVKRSTTATDRMDVCSQNFPFDYNGTTITGAGTYTVTIPNVAGCDSVITLTVVSHPRPEWPIVTAAARCGEGSVTLRATAGTNGDLVNWYAAADDAQTVATGNNFATSTLSETTTFYAASYNTTTGCESERVPVVATIHAVPGVPTVSNEVRCGASEVTLTAAPGNEGTTCLWYLSSNQNAAVQATALTFTQNVTHTITYYVESYNETTTCKSERVPVTVTIREIPGNPVLAPMSNCGATTFTVDAPTAGYLNWYESAQGGTPIASNTLTSPMVNASTSYFISKVMTYNDITCESGRSELALTIYPVYTPVIYHDTICQNDTYTGHGLNETFDVAGDYERTLSTVSAHGCDSVETVMINVKAKRYNQIIEVACDSYTWNGQDYTASGVYEQTFTAANGCDSIVALTLTIHPTKNSEFSAVACDSYTWNNEIYTVSGDYIQHFNTVNHCDSTVTLHLTIHNAATTTLNETACDQYTWNGQTYTASGVYTQNFQTVNGCDSTVTLNLTVNHSDNLQFAAQICAEERYVGYGFDTTANNAGVYTLVHRNQNVGGCDSTTTLTLTVWPTYHRAIASTICENATYNFNGRILTQAGTYYDTLQTVNGCDSTFILNLSISSEYRDTIVAHICAGQSYTQYGFNIINPTATMFETQELDASNGCDSVVVLHLYVHDLNTTTLSDAICEGADYTRYGFNLIAPEVGTRDYTRTVRTPYGCDSTIVLTLTVNPVYNLAFDGAICLGDRYRQNGFDTLPATVGTHTVVRHLQTAAGCDSIRTLTLTVNPTYLEYESATVCDNELPYIFRGHELNEARIYSYDERTVNGCDSIVIFTLTVNPTYNEVLTETICASALPYNFRGHILTEAGTYNYEEETVNGCDSTVTFTLNVNPTYREELTETICASALPHNFRGHELTAGGTFTYREQTINGCDSTVILTLIVNPTYDQHYTAQVCQGNGYEGYGFSFTAEELATVGEYERTNQATSVNGCDSIVTLTVTVTPVYNHERIAEICEGDVYTFNGRNYDETGDYPVRFTSVNGCDSIVTLRLTVNPVYSIDTTIVVCRGALPMEFAGKTFTEADNDGLYTLRLTSSTGCDSIYHVDFSIRDFNRTTRNVTICDSELPYHFQDSVFTQAGVYDVVQTSQDGCNTITHLTLTVNPTYLRNETVTLCANELPYIFGEESLTQSGEYTQTFVSSRGCDSTVVLTLNVLPNPMNQVLQYVCSNEYPVLYGGNSYTEPGIYTVVFARENACDSIVTLDLRENPSYNETLTETICASALPYDFRGHELTEGGVYTYEEETVNGCDSIVTFTLTVNPTYNEVHSATVCESELNDFSWRGQYFDEGGVYTYEEETVNGCDSIVTFTLTVNPEYYQVEQATICSVELPYTWRDTTFGVGTTTGNYILHRTTIHGCDSTVVLNLTVNPNYEYTDNDLHICAGGDVVWRGRTLTEQGAYTDTVINRYGCYDVYKVNVFVHETYSFEETATICASELPYQWHGRAINAAGRHTLTGTTEWGCDSIYYLNLIVNPSYNDVENISICAAALPYNFRGHLFNGDSTCVYREQTVEGCDSIVTFTLTVTPTIQDVVEPVTICANELPYNFRGHLLNGDSTCVYHETTAAGCDSVVTFTLIVNPTYNDTLTATICASELPYDFRGHEIAEGGIHTFAEETVNGCDSTVTLILTVNPTYNEVESAVVCDNALPYNFRGHEIASAGTYTYEEETVNGCDSIVTFTLTVNQTYTEIVEPVTICASELPYDFRGNSITAAGTYTYEEQTVNGCDSIVTFTLNVNPTFNLMEIAAVCESELPYTWRDTTFEQGTETGTYIFTRQTVNGCDSIVMLNLTVNPSSVFTENDLHICAGESVTWHGQSLTTGGTYNDTIVNYYGCHDIYTVTLYVHETYNFEESVTVCENELPYEWFGQEIQTAGTHTITDETVWGCDSIHVLNLTVNPTYNEVVSDAVCPSALPYDFRGHELTAAGTYTYEEESVNGCDSIVTFTLTVNPTYNETESAVVCDNALPYNFRGHEIAEAGTYTYEEETVNGCDSIVTFTLTVNPTYNETLTETICASALPYNFRGHELTAGGTFTYEEETVNGCDSMVIFTLTVNPTYNQVESASICSDELANYSWRGHTFTEGGVYTYEEESVNGCDSIVTFTLTVNPTYNFYDTLTICANELPYSWRGRNLTMAGNYSDVLQTATYCDSTYHFTLYVAPIFNNTVSASICANEVPYTWRGRTLEATGVYTDSLVSTMGCDSIYTLNLTVNPTIYSLITDTVCSNTLPYLWRGQYITAAGIYTDTIPNSYGCEDVYELRLSVNQVLTVTVYDTVCQGYQYSQHGLDTIPTTFGTIFATEYLTAASGCDSIINLVLTVNRAYRYDFYEETCDNEPFEWRGQTFTEEGDYYDTLQTIHGCDSVFVLHLLVNPTYEVFVEDSAMREHLYTGYGFSILPEEAGTYTYDNQLISSTGCDSIVHLTLYVAYNDAVEDYTKEREITLYPNPASSVVNIQGEEMRKVYLYSANGKLLQISEADSDTFTTIAVDDLATGYYLVKIEFADGKTVSRKVVVRHR